MNHFYILKNVICVWVEDPAWIEQAFIQYYENLLGTAQEHRTLVSQRIINEGLSLNVVQQEELCASFTNEDVKAGLFNIDENKDLGPDEYTSGNFKSRWPYIGGDIIEAILDLFQTSKLLKQVNSIVLCLIPQCEKPEDVSQFRPIAYCIVFLICDFHNALH